MSKKTLAYSGILIALLVAVSAIFAGRSVLGVVNDADIHLETDSGQYLLGQPIPFSASLDFALDEEATIHQARLVVNGPQPLDVALPVVPGTFDLSNAPGVAGQLTVTATFVDVTQLGGTIPLSSTLPGSTLPGSGGQYKGLASGAKIVYDIEWIPPVLLDPPPVFTLIPQTDELFAIPLLPGPEAQTGTVLPNTDLKFPIPTIGAPSGTVLPNLEELFNIPQITVSSTAPSELLDLPNTTFSFNIPTVSVPAAPTGVDRNFPDSTAAFDIPTVSVQAAPPGVPNLNDTTEAFAIPDLAGLGLIPTAPPGVSNLPASSEVFNTPGGASPRGLTTDGTDFWMIVDGTPVDQIYKLNSTGGVLVGPVDGPSDSLDGITFLNNSLWIIENRFRCFDDINGDTVADENRCDRNHRIFKVNPASLPASLNDWATLMGTALNGPGSELWREIGGITSQGSGPAGTLWLADGSFGDSFFRIDQSGNALDTVFVNQSAGDMEGAAFLNGTLYTSNGGTITSWNTSGVRGGDIATNPLRDNIRGMEFKTVGGEPVLYFASQTDNKVYAGFFATTVTQNPRGLAYSGSASSAGEAIWVLVDGDPKDMILKINATTGALVADFGPDSEGVAEAPSKDTEGIAYLNDDLWIIANEGFVRKLFKLNEATGAIETQFDLGNTANIFDDLGDLTHDGTNLIAYARDWNTVYVINPLNGERDSVNFPCCPPTLSGARGFAYHSGRNQYFFGKSGKIGTLNGQFQFQQENNVTEDAVSLTGIQGLVFNGNLLYVGIPGKVTVGFMATTVTTTPRGVAYSPTGSAAGRALWVLVDATPVDKLLKLNADNGAFVTAFGDNGAADAPAQNADGIAYLNDSLWIIAGRMLYQVNPANGAVANQFDLNFTASVWDDLGGITTDGTDLIVHSKLGNSLWAIDPITGQRSGFEQQFPCCPSFFGAKGLAYNSSRSQYFAASGGKIGTYSGSPLQLEGEVTAKETGVNITGIEGLAFEDNVLYIARPGKISKSFLAITVTTQPKGLAFTTSDTAAGRALWIVVNGDPKDKLLKVDPSTGSLITSFGSNGAVDAPTKNAEGITYHNNSLWIVANEGFERKLYEINPSTGGVTNTYNLGPLNVWDDLGGVTSNGAQLVVASRLFNTFWIIASDILSAEQRFGTCCPTFDGSRDIGYHSGRGQYFSVRGGKVGIFNSELSFLSEQTLKEGATNLNNIEGVVFNSDVIYVAYDAAGTGKVNASALRTTVTTNPRGIAFSPDGSSYQGSPIGRALWVMVDGDPMDKILKLDPDTGALDTTFGTDGAADAPSGRATGITYLGSTLWVIANNPDGQRLYQVNAVTGAELDSFNLSNPGGGGFGIFETLGGLTTDGTNLLAYGNNNNSLFTITTSGVVDEQTFTCCPSIIGGNGLAHRASNNQLFAAKNAKIIQYVSDDFGLFPAEEFSTAVTDIQGLTFVDDRLYVAHAVGKVSRAGVPSDITNNPLGLAYDPGAQELYILVDGKKDDHVIVVETEPDGLGNAVVIRDYSVPTGNAQALTFMNGTLYVSARNQDPFGPPGPPSILELNPADGAEMGVINLDGITFDAIMGLTNNGQSLIAMPEFGGPQAIFINPGSGFEERRVFFFDPFSFITDQMQGLALRTPDGEFFAVKGASIQRFDRFGKRIEEIVIATPGVGGLKGVELVNNTVYFAESNSKTVHAGLVPVPPTIITTNPRGMATDGNDLYIVVDAEPKDKIMKLDTLGNLVMGFGDQGAVDSPGTETDAAAFHNGMLYIVTNDERVFEGGPGGGGPGFFVDSFPRIHVLDPNTGAEMDSFEIRISVPEGPGVLFASVGALASDGTHLYAGVRGDEMPQGVWFKIDPNNPDAPSQPVGEFAGRFAFMPGFEAMEILSDPTFGPDKELIASGSTAFPGSNANSIARFNKNTGVMADQIGLPGDVDIQGMSYIGLTLYIANDASLGPDMVLGTALPERTIEVTVVGNYDGHVQVDVSSDLTTTFTTQSPVIVWDIMRNPQVILDLTTIDTVANGAVPLEDGFILTSTQTTINGRLNDPSIDEVEVGIALPFTVFVDDQVIDGVSQNLWSVDSSAGNGALWHVSCTPSTRTSSAPCSWRYSIPGGADFATGAGTMGTLTLDQVVEANEGSILEFNTGYITELAPERDLKVVEVAVVDTDVQGNDVVGEFMPVLQIVGKGGGFAPPPPNAHPSFHYVELDPLFINPTMVRVEVDLTPFEGDRVQVRFAFDSVDAFANNGEGWYLDDIRVSGAGKKTVFVQTTLLDPPAQVGPVTYYREFSTPFELAEGQNIVGAFGQQPYSPFQGHLVFATGFVDQTAPLVALFGIPGATSNLLQTLQGTIVDATFQSLEITQTTSAGSQVIFSLNSLPGGGSFSLPVSLVEGSNTFEATAQDGGGLESTASLAVIGDVTAPTASIKIVTITSDNEALIGDQYFVVVAAEDPLSGVASVEDVASGDPMPPISQVPPILVEMHQLNLVGVDPATHASLSSVQAGTPVGANSIAVRITDNAGNTAIQQGTLNVESARSNRNYFLFPGVNFAGLALIPDDGDPDTTDDASLDRLMAQDVTASVNPALASAMGGAVTLGDVIESTFAFNNAGNFIVHSPGAGAADTLTALDPFQGMTMKAADTKNVGGSDIDTFKKVSVAGFSAQQAVPIKMNIEGVFFRPGELPPDKTLRVGYNLVAPHILGSTLFDTVYRGALIPEQLAVSAITFERNVGAQVQGDGSIVAEIFEGFVTNSLGNLLKPVLSYWTFVVSDSPTNPTTPTITP
ncbi:MAG: hypothetical protein L0177_01140 [Chloroflexi bacterium]|nr:hypothetical protein [Chloroflexota bacterium]